MIDQLIDLLSWTGFSCFFVSEVRHNLNFVVLSESVTFFELPDKAEVRLMKC